MRTVFLISCAYLVAWPQLAVGQDSRKDEIQAVYPPSETERTQPGSEKFIVFGLEMGTATIWEYAAGWPALERRVSLVKSPWAPMRLLRDESPQLIRQQIKLEGRGYRVNMYAIDYRLWTVQQLYAARQIHGIGTSAQSVYVNTSDGLRVINPLTQQIHAPAQQFRRLRDLGRWWLVELEGEANSKRQALFDPKRRRLLQQIELPAFASKAHFGIPWIELSPSGRYLAMLEPLPFAEMPSFAEPKIAPSTIHIIDTQTSKTRTQSIRVLVRGGSGIPVIYQYLDLGFDSKERFTFVDIAPQAKAHTMRELDEARALTRTTIEMEPFSVKSEPARFEPPKARELPFVPSYLKPSRPITRQLDLLAEFLEHHDIEQTFRTIRDDRAGYTHCPVAFSKDGKRFLGALSVKDAGRVFYYGDLVRNQLVEVDAPTTRIPMIHCIETPL